MTKEQDEKMFCKKCGAEVQEGDKFCRKCGNQLPEIIPLDNGLALLVQEESEIETSEDKSVNDAEQKEVARYEYTEKYCGEDRVFSLLGRELHVSKELDSFMYYRNKFKRNAKVQMEITRQEYREKVYGLDQFFDVFPHIYEDNLKPLLANAFEIILSYSIYDITSEDFVKQHIADFCSVDNTFKTMQEAYNNTLISNENIIHKRYGSIPNIGFIGGIGTVLAVEAANYAIKYSYESSLNNVNVSLPQNRNCTTGSTLT